MCDKCDELDKRIEHYSRMLLSIGDQITVERIKALMGDLQAQKATLHPEQNSRPPQVGGVFRSIAWPWRSVLSGI
jgi:hypothetical protein